MSTAAYFLKTTMPQKVHDFVMLSKERMEKNAKNSKRATSRRAIQPGIVAKTRARLEKAEISVGPKKQTLQKVNNNDDFMNQEDSKEETIEERNVNVKEEILKKEKELSKSKSINHNNNNYLKKNTYISNNKNPLPSNFLKVDKEKEKV